MKYRQLASAVLSVSLIGTSLTYAAAGISGGNGNSILAAEEEIQITTEIQSGQVVKNGIIYNYDRFGSFCTVAGYEGEPTSIVIEETINNCTVTEISPEAFSGCDTLTSVTLPDSINYIWYSAFANCSSLSSINLPDNIEVIDASAFRNCTSLTGITLPANLKTISDGAFSGCTGLTEITLPDSVTSIGQNAFLDTGITKLHIGAGIDDFIEDLSSIPWDNINEITVSESSESFTAVDNVLFSKDMTELLIYPGGKTDKVYTIPDGVTTIKGISLSAATEGLSSFAGTQIEEIIIPDSVTTIEGHAFTGSNLLSVTIPENVDTIEWNAFSDCPHLAYVAIENPDCEIDSFGSPIDADIIYGYPGSTAEEYANSHGITFISLEKSTPSRVMMGDVNYDGVVDSVDASDILRDYANVAVGMSTSFSKAQLYLGDVNSDDAINVYDASIISGYYAYRLTGGDLSLEDWLAETETPAGDACVYADSVTGGFSETEIESSAVKPVISVSKLEIPENEAKGAEVEVTLSVDGASEKWCSAGLNLSYDERLAPAVTGSRISYTKGNALAYDTNVNICSDNSSNLFLSVYGTDNYNIDGDIISFKFVLPDDAEAGDSYPLSIEYVPGSLFTNSENDETGRLMQAYLFTMGLEDGYIKITESSEETTGEGTTSAEEPSIVPSSLTMKPGDTSKLLILNLPDGASVQWTSDNTGVASVDNGTVTAVDEGTAIIYALCGNTLMKCTVTVSEESTGIKYGDANKDGTVDINDAVLIMSHLANKSKYPIDETGKNNADVYQRSDGISLGDANSIQKYLAKIIKALPES